MDNINFASLCQSSSPSFDIITAANPLLSQSPPGVWTNRQNSGSTSLCASREAKISFNYHSPFESFQLIGTVARRKSGSPSNLPPSFMLDGLSGNLPLSSGVLFNSSTAVVNKKSDDHTLSVSNTDGFRFCLACFKFIRADAGVSGSGSPSTADTSPPPSSTSPAKGQPSVTSSLDPSNSKPTAQSASTSRGLSGPAKGVIIALVVALIVAFSLLIFAWLRKQRRRRQLPTPDVIKHGKSELDPYDGYIEMDTPVRTNVPRTTARYFASFSRSSVSSISQPPPSEEPPSTERNSVIHQLTSATLNRLRSLRREGLRRDREMNRRPVLRVANA